MLLIATWFHVGILRVLPGIARVITDADLGWYYRAQAAQWRAHAGQVRRDKGPAILKIADEFAALAATFEKSSPSIEDYGPGPAPIFHEFEAVELISRKRPGMRDAISAGLRREMSNRRLAR